MKLKTVEFLKGAVGPDDFPQTLPEVCVVGRSNVGKSSFLNFLTQRRKLVMTSKTPGKTREINFFTVNENFNLVDIPGFGYAKVSKKERESIHQVIENYFNNTTQLAGIIYLLDIRHGLTAIDKESIQWLDGFEFPIQFVLTKSDKLKKSQISKNISAITADLDLPVAPIVTSSFKKIGREEVWEQIEELLESLNPRAEEEEKEKEKI